MNPVILPASTVTTAAAGALTVILAWVLKQFADLEVPNEVSGAFTVIVSVLTAHFTTDNPSVTKVDIPAPPKNEVIEVNVEPSAPSKKKP